MHPVVDGYYSSDHSQIDASYEHFLHVARILIPALCLTGFLSYAEQFAASLPYEQLGRFC